MTNSTAIRKLINHAMKKSQQQSNTNSMISCLVSEGGKSLSLCNTLCNILLFVCSGDINIPRRHEDSDVTGREEGYNEEANGKLGVIMKLFSVRVLLLHSRRFDITYI